MVEARLARERSASHRARIGVERSATTRRGAPVERSGVEHIEHAEAHEALPRSGEKLIRTDTMQAPARAA